MPVFPANPQRRNPYATFRFRVMWDGRYVAGVSQVGALTRSTQVIPYRDGADSSMVHKAPGQTDYGEGITLGRGMSQDDEFTAWANKVWSFGSGLGMESSLQDFRKEVHLELLNEAGQVVKAWNLYRCWPSAFQTLPELDASANEVAIETLTLQCEGWERDESVTEQPEPQF